MHRCFLSEEYDGVFAVGDIVTIEGDEALHISKVLRLKVCDLFEMCNNTDYTFVCRITDIQKKSLTAEIVNFYYEENDCKKKVYLFQALSKGTKMDFVIQKATELGAYMLVPVDTEFSVVKINDKENKMNRWSRISVEAAKQCKRNKFMIVHEPVSFSEAVRMMSELDVGVIAYESEKENSLKKFLSSVSDESVNSIGMMIGPEGGFSKNEIEYSKENGIPSVTLGNRILRTETAAVSLLSVIMYEANELG